VWTNDEDYVLQDVFSPPAEAPHRTLISSNRFTRTEYEIAGRGELILDRFDDISEVSCFFLRSGRGPARSLGFGFRGECRVRSCAAGGWLLAPSLEGDPVYWIPRPPTLRAIDAHGRILSEQPAAAAAFELSSAGTRIEIGIPADVHLDWVVWQLPSDAADIAAALERLLVLEMQSTFMWGSHTALRGPADVYRYLVHGHVYENRFEWRHKWKICAENEAYALYVTLNGLELATGKRLYGLLKRQILLSVVARQSEDGGWYHGEWSDFMESHYRLHNGAVLLLEAALEEYGDDSVRSALAKAAAFTARHTDRTRLGLWFLHDSLEEDVELLLKTGSRLVPSRVLGKSPGTKLILNTHLDSMVVLDRYREVTGDDQYADRVASAREAMRGLLSLRPAEALYRLVSRAVRLTFVPPTRAEKLPLPWRAARHAAREYLLPRLHRIKRRFPRMVMPGGLVERHLSMPHHDLSYQTVNLMDLLRVQRRFPDEDLDAIVTGAIAAVRETDLLDYWIETKQRQALGYWPEALYHLCMLHPAREYRGYLAAAILIAEDAALGLPPSLLGANPEAAHAVERVACPSPADPRLRVANLSRGRSAEILVVNCSAAAIALEWETAPDQGLSWTAADGRPVADIASPAIPPRAWLLGTLELH
jgi:hypothetical protein